MPEPTQPDKAGPQSFDEIEALPSRGRSCRFCSEQATHRIQTIVRSVTGSTGAPPKVVDHLQDYCEAHAAGLFHKIRQAMR